MVRRAPVQRPQRMVRRAPVQRPLGPIVGMAAIDGLWRSVRWRRHGEGHEVVWPTGDHRRIEMGRRQAVLVATSDSAALAAIAMAIVALVISPHFSLSLLLANRFQIFGSDPSVSGVERAEHMLSLGVTVAASDSLVPLLLNRDNPLVMTPDSVRGSWVLAWTGISQYPYRPQGQMLHQLNRMEEHGWTVLFERAGG